MGVLAVALEAKTAQSMPPFHRYMSETSTLVLVSSSFVLAIAGLLTEMPTMRNMAFGLLTATTEEAKEPQPRENEGNIR